MQLRPGREQGRELEQIKIGECCVTLHASMNALLIRNQ